MIRPIRYIDLLILAISAALIGVIAATQIVFLQAGLVANDQDLIWHLVRATGLIGYLSLGGSMIWGLWLTTGIAKNWSPGAMSNTIHITLSWIAVVFSLTHAALLLFDEHFTYTILDIFIPFRDEFEPLAIGAGIIAFWLALVINLSFQVRKWMGYRSWKILHLASYLCFGMVTYHTLIAGTDNSLMGLRLMIAALLSGTIMFLTSRVITHHRV